VDPDPGRRTSEGSYALFVGRVSQEKGAPTLLKAWRELPGNLPLRVIGDGPARAQLQSEATAQGLTNVTFMGRLRREQVMEAMKQARFLIFPSQLYENLPLTIIEAFACGVPVLASRLGAMQEVVEDERTGLFFEPGNSSDLASVVALAWKRPNYMLQLGKQARAEYETKYTATANYRSLMKIYDQVIADNSENTGVVRVKDLQELSSN